MTTIRVNRLQVVLAQLQVRRLEQYGQPVPDELRMIAEARRR